MGKVIRLQSKYRWGLRVVATSMYAVVWVSLWAGLCEPAPAAKVLLVTAGATLTTQETYKKQGLEGMGHTVTTIEDASSQSAFNTALASVDVVYVNEDVLSTDLGYKLRETTVGVVCEEQALDLEFGFSSSDGYGQTASTISITDNSHAVTTGFSIGSLSLTYSNQPLIAMQGTMAPGGQILATVSSAPCVMVVETGNTLATTYNSSNVALGRRVRLPWGGNAFDVTSLNSSAQTLASQAVTWAATKATVKSLVLHWRLDESSGTTASDSSTGSHHGTVSGTANWIEGRREGGHYFNGSSKVEVNHLLGKPADFTIACWAKVDAVDTSGADAISIGDYITLRFTGSNGTPSGRFYSGSSTYRSVSSSMKTVGTGWHHYAVVFKDSTNSYKLYIDGVLVNTSTQYSSISWSGLGTYTRAGRHGNGSTAYDLVGGLDDVRVYNYALTDSEVGEVYGLIGHWKLNETSGSTAADSSLVDNDGSYWNGATPASAGPFPGRGANAANFDGVNDLVGAYPHDAYDRMTEGVSVAAWVMFDTGVANQTSQHFPVLCSDWGDQTGFCLMTDQPYSNNLIFRVFNGSTYEDASYSGDNFAAGDWHHLVGTYDGDNIKLYVDGKLVHTTAFTATLAPATGSYMDLGWAHDGRLYDVRVFNRAIREEEIAKIYGLVGQWRFEEGSGNTAADSSGAGNPGTGEGLLGWSDESREGDHSLSLDGNNNVRVSGMPISAGSDAALTGWAKLITKDDGGSELISVGDTFAIRLDSSTGVYAFINVGATWEGASSGTDVEGTGWHHFAAVYEDDAQQLRLYIDGELKGTQTTSAKMTVLNSTYDTYLGKHPVDIDKYLDGLLDDLRVYNRAISVDEITSLFEGGNPGGIRILKWVEKK